jgi:hypothetical protein
MPRAPGSSRLCAPFRSASTNAMPVIVVQPPGVPGPERGWGDAPNGAGADPAWASTTSRASADVRAASTAARPTNGSATATVARTNAARTMCPRRPLSSTNTGRSERGPVIPRAEVSRPVLIHVP